MDFALLHTSVPSPFVYVHYPLCRHTCSYCDFNVYTEGPTKASMPDFEERWIQGLSRDLRTMGGARERLRSLYLGGGTPSLISAKGLEGLLRALDVVYEIPSGGLDEFSLECNPETLTEQNVQDFRSLGVTRPSLGVQSFQPLNLKRLERLATLKHIEKSVDLLAHCFSNFSLDLMIGTPDQDLDSLKKDLARIEAIRPPHLSIYILTVSPDHIFKTHPAFVERTPHDDLASQMYLEVCEAMDRLGYDHYEVSNFARPGFRSLHNSNYWNINSDYLGLGPGAHGYAKLQSGERLRYERARDPQAWMSSESGLGFCEVLNSDQTKLEELYMNLRTRRPILAKSGIATYRALLNEGLLIEKEPNEFVASDRGWLVMESLAERLLAA